MMDSRNITVTSEQLVRLRDLVITHPTGLDKWPMIVDSILKLHQDVIRTKKLIRDGEYSDAVLLSLQTWHGYGDTRVNLLEVLRRQGLVSLAEVLVEEFGHQSPIWFEVGEVPRNFTGRIHELESLHEDLTTSSRNATFTNLTCIYGLGGVGKSTLVRKYAERYKNYYMGNILQIQSGTMESIRASFIRLAAHLQLKVDERTPIKKLTSDVYQFLDRKCLFILDNLGDMKHLKYVQPKFANSESNARPNIHFLLTTRRIDSVGLAPMQRKPLKLNVLAIEEAVNFIQRAYWGSAREDAAKLAVRLQRLPLALQMALAYLNDPALESSDNSILAYLEGYQATVDDILKTTPYGDSDYTLTVLAAWKLTLGRIQKREDCGEAVWLIKIMSYLNPDRISEDFLSNLPAVKTEPALRVLTEFSLVSTRGGFTSIHRMVQQVIRLEVNPEQELKILKLLSSFIVKQLDGDGHGNADTLLHALWLFQFQVKYVKLLKDEFEYLTKLCDFLHKKGRDSEALSIAEQVVKAYKKEYNSDDEVIVRMQIQVAAAHLHLQNHKEALHVVDSICAMGRAGVVQELRRMIDKISAVTTEHARVLKVLNASLGEQGAGKFHGDGNGNGTEPAHDH